MQLFVFKIQNLPAVKNVFFDKGASEKKRIKLKFLYLFKINFKLSDNTTLTC